MATETSAQNDSSSPSREGAAGPTVLERLAGRQLVVVTGKGGVGKSTVASALGACFARPAPGRAAPRVLVLEVDPRENVHRLFGIPPSGGEIVHAGGGLYLQNLKPRQVLDRIVREQVKIGPLASRVLSSPIYDQFAAGMPGLKEVALASHALRLTRREGEADAFGGPLDDVEPFDVVVLDAPATGHGVSLLAAPLLVAEAIPSGPVGKLARELADLVADPSRTGIAVVTLAEEMPVDEALELRAMLDERLDRRPELLVANSLYPPLPDGFTARDEAGRLWRDRRRINEEELARARERWTGPILELPLLPLTPGRELVEALAGELRRGAEEAA